VQAVTVQGTNGFIDLQDSSGTVSITYTFDTTNNNVSWESRFTRIDTTFQVGASCIDNDNVCGPHKFIGGAGAFIRYDADGNATVEQYNEPFNVPAGYDRLVWLSAVWCNISCNVPITTVTFDPLPTVPLPASLPLFVTGLGIFVLIGWRRRRMLLLTTH
jgi:hypothetical protein